MQLFSSTKSASSSQDLRRRQVQRASQLAARRSLASAQLGGSRRAPQPSTKSFLVAPLFLSTPKDRVRRAAPLVVEEMNSRPGGSW